jgi:hypothetical protein
MMLRRAAVTTVGLAMATSFGLAGAGMALAAAPALKEIKPGATWTFVAGGGGCELDVFNTTTHHFTSDVSSDKGTWSGGGSTVSMVWKKGGDAGATFSGTFSKRPSRYLGPLRGHLAGKTGELVKGALHGC